MRAGSGTRASAVGSKLEPVLELNDAAGQTAAESASGALGHTCAKDGVYVLSVRDKDYRGGKDMHYRLHVGDVPVVTSVFPLGATRGTDAEVYVEGVHLGDLKTVKVKVPADAAPGSTVPVPVQTPAAPRQIEAAR